MASSLSVQRLTDDALRARVARPRGSAARGRLRIYLGCAPGAGTTCALLSEGHRRAEDGTDVVVASAETHGRPHTEALLAGLEIIPPANVPYQGTTFEEIDLAAVLARRPTEIGVLNGGIVRRGREAGVPVALNQAVTALINGLEQSWAS